MLYCLFFFASLSSFASDITLNKHVKQLQEIPFEYIGEPLTLAQAQTATQWQPMSNQILNLGMSETVAWLRVNLTNQEALELPIILSVDNPLLDKVSVYQYHNNEVVLFKEIGDALPLKNRQIKNESLLVKLILPAQSTSTLLLRIENEAGLRAPLSLWQSD